MREITGMGYDPSLARYRHKGHYFFRVFPAFFIVAGDRVKIGVFIIA